MTRVSVAEFDQGLSGLAKLYRIDYEYQTPRGSKGTASSILKIYSKPFDTRSGPERKDLPADAFEVAVYHLYRSIGLGEYFPRVEAHFPFEHAYEMEFLGGTSMLQVLKHKVLQDVERKLEMTVLAALYNKWMMKLAVLWRSEMEKAVVDLHRRIVELKNTPYSAQAFWWKSAGEVCEALGKVHTGSPIYSEEFRLPKVNAAFPNQSGIAEISGKVPVMTEDAIHRRTDRALDSIFAYFKPDEPEKKAALSRALRVVSREIASQDLHFIHGDLNIDNVILCIAGDSIGVKFIDVLGACFSTGQRDLAAFLEDPEVLVFMPGQEFLKHSAIALQKHDDPECFTVNHNGRPEVRWPLLMEWLSNEAK